MSTTEPPRPRWNEAPRTITLAFRLTGSATTNDVFDEDRILTLVKLSTTLFKVAIETVLFIDAFGLLSLVLCTYSNKAFARSALLVLLLVKMPLANS